MKHQRSIAMRRIIGVNATLNEEDIEHALVRATLMKAAPELVEAFDGPAAVGRKFTTSVSLSERTGEAEVNVTYEVEVESTS